jgi:hypothetical protein
VRRRARPPRHRIFVVEAGHVRGELEDISNLYDAMCRLYRVDRKRFFRFKADVHAVVAAYDQPGESNDVFEVRLAAIEGKGPKDPSTRS